MPSDCYFCSSARTGENQFLLSFFLDSMRDINPSQFTTQHYLAQYNKTKDLRYFFYRYATWHFPTQPNSRTLIRKDQPLYCHCLEPRILSYCKDLTEGKGRHEGAFLSLMTPLSWRPYYTVTSSLFVIKELSKTLI